MINFCLSFLVVLIFTVLNSATFRFRVQVLTLLEKVLRGLWIGFFIIFNLVVVAGIALYAESSSCSQSNGHSDKNKTKSTVLILSIIWMFLIFIFLMKLLFQLCLQHSLLVLNRNNLKAWFIIMVLHIAIFETTVLFN
jgi:phosphatidylglycerophosphate synthase